LTPLLEALQQQQQPFGVVVGLLASAVNVLLVFTFPDNEQVSRVPASSLSSGEKESTTEMMIEVPV
jgi:hypothetical protein